MWTIVSQHWHRGLRIIKETNTYETHYCVCPPDGFWFDNDLYSGYFEHTKVHNTIYADRLKDIKHDIDDYFDAKMISGGHKIMGRDMDKDKKWRRDNLVPFNLRLNKKADADVIEHLKKQTNKRDYLIGLIRDDIAKDGTYETD